MVTKQQFIEALKKCAEEGDRVENSFVKAASLRLGFSPAVAERAREAFNSAEAGGGVVVPTMSHNNTPYHLTEVDAMFAVLMAAEGPKPPTPPAPTLPSDPYEAAYAGRLHDEVAKLDALHGWTVTRPARSRDEARHEARDALEKAREHVAKLQAQIAAVEAAYRA